MNFDWNWFFSSFSQSAAALLGIIAAFLISRLIGLNERIDSTISHFESLQIDFLNVKERLSNRFFDWYCELKIDYSRKIKTAIQKGEFDELENDTILSKIYEIEPNLFKADEAILRQFNSTYKESRWRENSLNFIATAITDKMDEELEAINILKTEANKLILQFQKNRNDMSRYLDTINSCKRIIIILLIAFPVTVIYPLHFMPLTVSQLPKLSFTFDVIANNIFSLRGALLILFFAAVEGIVGYFLYMTYDLETKINKALKSYVEFNYSDIKNYSPYLG